jgi:hypothetical protein
MATTFELVNELAALVQALDDAVGEFDLFCAEGRGDTEPEAGGALALSIAAAETALESWSQDDVPAKILAIEADSRQCKGWAAMAREEAKRHAARAKALDGRIERNSGNVLRLMQAQHALNGSASLRLPGGRVATLRSRVSSSVEVTDLEALPQGLYSVKRTPDKKAIAAAMKVGTVPGARMVETVRASVGFRG